MPTAVPELLDIETLAGRLGDSVRHVRRLVAEKRIPYLKVGYATAKLAADVGERVRLAREAAGISQRELARRMGTSQAAVGRLEAGGVGATLPTLQRAANALGLEVTVELRPSA